MVLTNEAADQFCRIVNSAQNIVFFGGAGVSTESGIPDFRSEDGLYRQHYAYPPETILSHGFFWQETEEFYRFYRAKMNPLAFQPNLTHRALAYLEKIGKVKAVITQNIDGLHQKAGSKTVFELHGSVLRNYCTRCGQFYGAETIFEGKTPVPLCDKCGGVIKPDVVLYQEGLNDETVRGALRALASADTLIVGGTSLTVYPAAGLVQDFRGQHLVLINRDATPLDHYAELALHVSLGQAFAALNLPLA